MNWIFYFIFIFVLYSFIGWIVEEMYSYFTEGKFKKEGFLSSPFKPMYGVAMLLTTLFYHFLGFRGLFMWILFFIIPTAVEYISGYVLRRIFNKEYWDYKKIKYNYKGLICFKFSSYWFLLISITTIFIEPIIYIVYLRYITLFNIIGTFFTIYITLDAINTIRNILLIKTIPSVSIQENQRK